ncbi:MAG TPA: aldose 1-epimerase, partial [Puia sp.]|nr:aldose 1-epimerase [Puia sp.]
MRFQIRRRQDHALDLIEIEDTANGTVVSLLPGFGGMLHGFSIQASGGSSVQVIDSYKDLAELQAGLKSSYKGAKLSPWPCRIRDGKYRFDGKQYQFMRLFSDGSAIHGLLADRTFGVLEEAAGDHSGGVTLEYNYHRDDPGYPFEYSCHVRYILHPDSVLEVVTSVTNLDASAIPIADGWHPYFKLGGRIDDWELQFHSAAIVEFDRQLVPTGRLLQYDRFETPRRIGETALDNCFSVKPDLVSAACEVRNPATGLKVSFLPDARYPYLQIYTPPHRTSIAVENLSGTPDCFNNQMGLT